jgi:hypothetical protein
MMNSTVVTVAHMEWNINPNVIQLIFESAGAGNEL